MATRINPKLNPVRAEQILLDSSVDLFRALLNARPRGQTVLACRRLRGGEGRNLVRLETRPVLVADHHDGHQLVAELTGNGHVQVSVLGMAYRLEFAPYYIPRDSSSCTARMPASSGPSTWPLWRVLTS